MNAEPSLRIESTAGVVTVTVDRPEQRNALSDELLAELTARLVAIDEDADARCVVIAGGDKVFVSGADVRALLARGPLEIYVGDRGRHWEAIRRLRTPIVAAVSGLCLGGGCELAMMADLVVASETARFGLPETQLGLIPGAGGTQMLPRAIGKAKAMDMVLTGRLLSADEAERAGLISRIAPAGEWLSTAQAVAEKIAARSAIAQRAAKESVQQAFETGLQAGIVSERRAFAMTFGSDDAREGLNAFIEKRTPEWRHR
jgi:enoyl-CoA hydratase